MEKAESKLSIARVPKTEETTCIGKCLLCHLPKSDETIEGMIRFVTYPPNHTTDAGAQVLCANTIAPLIMSANNTTDYEIINKVDLKNEYGTGSDVLYALSRCRSLFSRVGKEWNERNSEKKEYFLVKEFERHLKLVQDPCSRTDNQDFTSASNQTVRKTSNLSPRTKLNDKRHKKKAEVNTDSDKDLLQNVFDRIHSLSLPSIPNFVPSPENKPQAQDHQISHDINSFGTLEKLLPRSQLNDQPHENNLKTNSDTGSLRKILNCVPFPENGSQTQEHQSSHKIHSFEKPRQLASNPELIDQSNERNPKMDSDDVSSHPDVLNNVSYSANGSKTKERKSSYNMDSPGSKYNSLWDQKYKELVKYIAEFGHARVPHQYTLLGRWVTHQRSNYKIFQKGHSSTRMTEKRIELLNQIGFEWDSQGHSWKTLYEKLVEFATENGHTRVPHKFPPNQCLAYWVTKQRLDCKKFQKRDPSSRMTEKRMELLNAIGFEWDKGPTWETSYEQLFAFTTENGHSRVPRKYPQNPPLAYWVHTQRFQYKKFQKGDISSKMTEKRIELLERIGFEWHLGGPPWDNMYDELCQFVNRYGHCRAPARRNPKSFLGDWILRQRVLYKQIQKGILSSTLTEGRIELLNKIGFDWDNVQFKRSQHKWNERYQELVCYVEKYGNIRIPRNPQNATLADWAHKQRQDYKQLQKGETNKLTEDRIELLNKIGFDWGSLHARRSQDHWNERYMELLCHVEECGSTRVSRDVNPSLYNWSVKQREYFRVLQQGKLSKITEDRVQLLDKIGFEWECLAQPFKRKYAEL